MSDQDPRITHQRPVPRSLEFALRDLQTEISDEFPHGPTVVSAIERFADELIRLPGAEDELRHRASYVSEHCKSGTRFDELLKSALNSYVAVHEAIKKRRARQEERSRKIGLPNPGRIRPKEIAIERIARESGGEFEFLCEITEFRKKLEFAKREDVFKAGSIQKINDLLEEVICVEDGAAHIEADGSYYLFHVHRGRSPSCEDAAGIRVLLADWGRIHWPSILKAADLIIEWVRTGGPQGTKATECLEILVIPEQGPPWAPLGTTNPPRFSEGPLDGKKKDLVRWIRPQAADSRSLETMMRDGIIWVRKDGRFHFSAFFRSRDTFEAAQKRRFDDQTADGQSD